METEIFEESRTDYACSVSEEQLAAASLQVLFLAREAIIYAALAINDTEKNKDKNDASLELETPIADRTRMTR
ncbi:MAG: hypothetical protein ACRBCK_12120 [Alphaproteobacteria bacterium]